jgi:integral membrane sensor domain MASE1
MDTEIQEKKVSGKRILTENLLVAVGYLGISHLNFIFFKNVGVLPMPIWPAASLAIIAAFYRGWKVAPGIAIGTILANHLSLGAPLIYACCISVMNTIGPIIGSAIMRNRLSEKLQVKSISDAIISILAIALLTPILSACGGIGFKWLLGLIKSQVVFIAWCKWLISHSSGTIFFAIPIFVWLGTKIEEEN